MNIFILGSGWLALPLSQQLTQLGHHVTVSCTSHNKLNTLHQSGYNALIYCIGQNPPMEMLEADVVIMANTCKDIDAYRVMLSNWPHRPSQQIIYTSSTAVYQDNGSEHDENSTAINHNHPTWQIEQLLKSHQSNILRLSGLVGPNRHPGRFFRKTAVIRNPNNPVNLIHIDDAMGLLCSIMRSQARGLILNGCADNHPSKGDYYRLMADQLDGTQLDASQATTSAGKTIINEQSKKRLQYTYHHPDVWHMPFETSSSFKH